MNVQNKEAHRRFIAARTAMVLDEPFWGMLSSRLQLVEDPSCPTAWTDGVSLGYNPEFVLAQTQRQLIALASHETEHCARGHPWRKGPREHKKFNVAADLAINSDLRRCGFTLPDGALFPEQYELPEGKSAEWYYDRLPADAGKDDQSGGGSGSGSGKPDPLGEVRDAPTPATDVKKDDVQPTEEGWRQAVLQAAAIAQGQGKLPAGLERLVEQAKKSRIDWQSALLRYAQEMARSDYTWKLPNPRYVSRGLYLPALRNQEVGILAIGMDSSGSIDKVVIEQFTGVIQGISDQVRPRKIVVFHCDAKVHRVEEFEPGDPIELHPIGGGGTDFRPVFKAIEEMEESPACVIYLTDLDGTFPKSDPGIPVLWVTAREDTRQVPFGDVLCAA